MRQTSHTVTPCKVDAAGVPRQHVYMAIHMQLHSPPPMPTRAPLPPDGAELALTEQAADGHRRVQQAAEAAVAQVGGQLGGVHAIQVGLGARVRRGGLPGDRLQFAHGLEVGRIDEGGEAAVCASARGLAMSKRGEGGSVV